MLAYSEHSHEDVQRVKEHSHSSENQLDNEAAMADTVDIEAMD